MAKDEFLELLDCWKRDAFESMAASAFDVRAELCALSEEILARDGTLERNKPKANSTVTQAVAKVANSRE